MVVYLQVNENNVITGVYSKKLLDTFIAYETADVTTIHVGIDKFENGQFISNTEEYEKEQLNAKIYDQIQTLKQKLFDTDYQAIKFAEGELTEEEFAPIRAQRHNWRLEIEELESQILR